MTTARVRSQSARKLPTHKTPRTRQRRSPSLLILECDPEKLAGQNITLAGELHWLAGIFAPTTPVHLIQAETLDTLPHRFADYATDGIRPTLITVVGHSGLQGLRLTADHRASWPEFARWLAPLEPLELMIAGCEGGRWPVCEQLFNGVLTLRTIYGAPARHTAPQARVLIPLALCHLAGTRLKRDTFRATQALNFALTRGVVFQQTRPEFERGDPMERLIWHNIEECLKHLRSRAP